MKKTIIYMIALCAVMSLSFVSCSDSDDTSLIPTVVVTDAKFTDTNEETSKISGELTWKAPESVTNVTNYVIYASSNKTEKEVKLGEVPVGTNSFTITDTNNLGYLLIVAANSYGESKTFVWLQVEEGKGGNDSFSALYVLNEGSYGHNNSTLTYYDITKGEAVQDYFYVQNKRGLGDTAQDMIVYGDKMYIAVTGESTIEVTDLQAKSIVQIRTEGQPRSMVSYGGKVYITYYNGYVARLDTTVLTVDSKVRVGRNPEQLVVANNKLYVANSGGMDLSSPTGADKTVSVIDLSSFIEVNRLEVALNPKNVQVDNQGNVYVISMGDYISIPNKLQRIDSQTNEVSLIGNTTEMAYSNGTLYSFYSQWLDGVQYPLSFLTYNTNTQVEGGSFIKDGTAINSPYKISTAGSNVYVTSSNFINDGDVYAFDLSGTLVNTFETGLNPVKVVLANK